MLISSFKFINGQRIILDKSCLLLVPSAVAAMQWMLSGRQFVNRMYSSKCTPMHILLSNSNSQGY